MHDPTVVARIGAWKSCCMDFKDLYLCNYDHPISQEEIDELKDITYFTETELYETFDLWAFHSRNLELSPRTNLKIENDAMFRRIRSFWVCPFTDRLMKIFSSDGEWITFTDYMDMFNTFHRRTPVEYRQEVAFRIHDFDGDGFIGVDDVVELLRRSTDGVLDEEDYWDVAVEVVIHYDYDFDGKIGLSDFKQGVADDLDFPQKFVMNTLVNRDTRML